MQLRFRIKVIESPCAQTRDSKKYVIEADYIGHGNSSGACSRDAQNQAETDWKTQFLNSWIASREREKKDSIFSTTCLEFIIVRRY